MSTKVIIHVTKSISDLFDRLRVSINDRLNEHKSISYSITYFVRAILKYGFVRYQELQEEQPLHVVRQHVRSACTKHYENTELQFTCTVVISDTLETDLNGLRKVFNNTSMKGACRIALGFAVEELSKENEQELIDMFVDSAKGDITNGIYRGARVIGGGSDDKDFCVINVRKTARATIDELVNLVRMHGWAAIGAPDTGQAPNIINTVDYVIRSFYESVATTEKK